ncbi:hypothetical protein BDZ45DRAFT_759166 [Acephala macrosclerotiorum]|nr:hypothetical protein BDZ45DRAFT_759166 [Acephala macrosclerotiorum]
MLTMAVVTVVDMAANKVVPFAWALCDDILRRPLRFQASSSPIDRSSSVFAFAPSRFHCSIQPTDLSCWLLTTPQMVVETRTHRDVQYAIRRRIFSGTVDITIDRQTPAELAITVSFNRACWWCTYQRQVPSHTGKSTAIDSGHTSMIHVMLRAPLRASTVTPHPEMVADMAAVINNRAAAVGSSTWFDILSDLASTFDDTIRGDENSTWVLSARVVRLWSIMLFREIAVYFGVLANNLTRRKRFTGQGIPAGRGEGWMRRSLLEVLSIFSVD